MRINYLEFEINDKKINGIVSNDLYTLNNICEKINYNYKNSFLISINNLNSLCQEDLLNMDINSLLNYKLDKKIINKDINYLSISEKIRLLFLKCLSYDYDVIIFDCILEILDSDLRTLIIKKILDLNKFKGKTIIISSIDINIIYEIIDSLAIFNNKKCIYYGDKYNVPENFASFIKKIEKKIYENSNINLGNNDSINELIKAIYREVR